MNLNVVEEIIGEEFKQVSSKKFKFITLQFLKKCELTSNSHCNIFRKTLSENFFYVYSKKT